MIAVLMLLSPRLGYFLWRSQKGIGTKNPGMKINVIHWYVPPTENSSWDKPPQATARLLNACACWPDQTFVPSIERRVSNWLVMISLVMM